MKEFFSNFRNALAVKPCLLALALLLAGTGAAMAQTASVRGKVTDESGSPLVGVAVVIENTYKGTTTDASGNYAIDAPVGSKLVFSFIGMLSQTAAVEKGTARIDITLKDDAARLEDVVVIGYGTSRRADVTAAVSQVEGKELAKMPMTNLSQGLAGRVTGLISVQNSGQPGADQASMTIRGSKAGILYIVDGIPRSINDINPNDVESVTLLKDGAAVAIYGLEGAGGVMIVTTKKGGAAWKDVAHLQRFMRSFIQHLIS